MCSIQPYSRILRELRKCNSAVRCFIAAAMLCTQTMPLMANPVDGVVSAGSANISSAGNTLTVTQQTDKAVIDWRGFDIAHGETTQFVQPSSASMTLNRIGGNAPSFIDGNLNANGNLVLVNPNGVVFGSGARVDVNGLIASTADISNDKFMNSAGILDFDKAGDPDAMIVNDGLITAKEAGLVGLVAPNVINRGVILAKLGRVALASGDTATVDLYGDGLIKVAVSDKVKSQLVGNSGLIEADGGTIALTAAAGKNIVNSLISVPGELAAPSVQQHNGKIIIAAEGSNKTTKQGSSTVLVSGILDASGRNAGERGGSIVVTGDNIGLLDGTRIDASGSDGLSGTTLGKLASAIRNGSAGGDIRIGGDYLGQGDTPTALNLYVDSGALILNDAINSGDAGRTIFWADDTTRFYGNVYARALAGNGIDANTWHANEEGRITSNTGDGGFVETSGHGHLDVGGYVDLTASNGARGTYFLDPTDITIYGNFAPNYSSVVQGDATALSSSIKMWLDSTDQTKVTLTYNGLGTTATGTSGNNTITVSANTGLVVGARIRLGGAGTAALASTLGADTYTITAISGTTITLSSPLTANYTTSSVFQSYVSQITDSSGAGNNATQVVAAKMPLWTINGAQYNGTSQYLDGAAVFPAASDYTIISLVKQTANTTGNIFSSGSGTGDHAFYFASGNAIQLWRSSTSFAVSATTVPLNTVGLFDGTFNNTTKLGTVYVNDKSTGSGTAAGAFAGTTIQIGAHQGANYFTGQIYNSILYSTVLSTNARNLVDQYVSAQYNSPLTPPGSGVTEAAQATASIQKGDAADGYSVFTTRYLERLSQSANISLQASNNINLDLKGDTLNFSTAGRSLTLTAGNQITTASTGTITTNGGAISMYANDSIAFNNAFTLNSNGGAILLNADRDASGAGAVKLSSTVINSGGGNVTIGGGNGTITAGTGYAVGTATYADGVAVVGGSINAAGGSIIINGKSSVTSTSFISGVNLDSATNVNTTGSGTIGIYGLGNNGSGTANRGVRIVNGAIVSGQNGIITINATGGGGTGATANNYGVFLGGTGGYVSTNGTGNINVIGVGGAGTGGVNYGVYITNAGSFIKTTGTGSVNITGTAGAGASSYGFLTDIANAVVTSGTAGNITLLSDTISVSGAGAGYNLSAVGTLTIAPLTAITMGVGTSAGGALNLTDANLLNLSAGSFVFGSATAGNLTINTTKNFGTSNVAFTSGGTTSLNNTVTTTNAAISLTGVGGILVSSTSTLTSGGGAININSAMTLNAALTFNDGGSNNTIANVISGTGSLTKQGSGTLTLGGANTYSGGTTISVGAITFGNADGLGSGGSSVSIASGATLNINDTSGNNISYSHIWSGAGSINYSNSSGTGNYIAGTGTGFTGVITTSGAGKPSFSAIDFSNASLVANATATIVNGGTTVSFGSLAGSGLVRQGGTVGLATLIIGNLGTSTTFSGIVTDSSAAFALQKVGSGTLTLSGANTYTGTTTITAGTLQISGSGGLGGGTYGGALSIASGALFEYSSSATQTLSGVISGAGALTKDTSTTSTLTLSGVNTYTGATTVSAGTVQVGGSGSLGSGLYTGAISVASGTVFKYSSSAAQTLSGIISGAGALTKDTSTTSTLTLSGANTYTGATTVNAGTLAITNSGGVSTNANISGQKALTTSAISVASGAVASISLGTNFSSTNTGMTLSGAGTISLVSNSVWWMGGSSAGTTISMSAGGVLDAQAGILRNDYGNVNWTANQGDLNLAATATLDLRTSAPANNNVYIAKLTGLGTVDNIYPTTNTITIGVGNASSTFDGVIKSTSGNTNLIKTGTGTLTLNGLNNYTGTTTINGGTLQIGGSGSLGGGTHSGAISIASGATLEYSSSATQTLSGVISGAGAVTKDTSSSTLKLSGTDTYTGATTVSAGTLQVTGSGSLGSGTYAGNISLASGSTFKYSSSAAQTLSGVISGAGALTKDTSTTSTLTLSGSNTYSGTTTLNAGVINLSGVLSFTSGLTIASGATLNYTGSAAYNKICYSCGTWTISGTLNNALTTGTVAQTLPSVVNLNGGTISGSGLTADVWGDYAISQSTQIIATGASTISGILRGTTALTFNTATVSDSIQVSGVLANNSTMSVAKTGLGAVTLSGANTYTGNTTVSGGSLNLSGSWNVGAGTANVSVASGATLSGTGTVTAGNLVVSGLGTVSLTGNNAVGTLSGSGTNGDITFKNANTLALGSITANSITVQTTSATADITIASGKVITATGSGTPLTLISGRNFINNAGSGALVAGAGRWLVYSANPANDTIGGLNNGFRRFSCTYGCSCPAFPSTGNGLLYATTPVLTITPDAVSSIVYGAAAPNLSGYAYTVSGYLGSDASADSLTGTLTGSSTYVQGSNVGTYNINYGLGTLASAMGYSMSYANNASAITVTARPITVTADSQTKVYGASDPSLTYQITSGSLYNTDTISGALSRIAGSTVAGGPYTINQNTLTAGGNYNLTYVGSTLSITPAPLTITANAQSKVYGTTDPGLTYGVSGLTNGDTNSVFTGALARVAGENVGNYGIAQNTLSAGSNYAITYTGNNLAITRATLNIIANAQSKIHGAADPTLTYGVSGLTNGDTNAIITGALSRVAGENTGSYAINQNTLTASNNYTINYTGNNLSITLGALTVTANAMSKVAGAVDPTLTYTVSGLTNGDTLSIFTGALSRAAGENAGIYAINQNTLSAGTNYTLIFVGNDFTITPAPVKVSAKSKLLGAALSILADIPVTVTRVSQDPTLVMPGSSTNSVSSQVSLSTMSSSNKMPSQSNSGQSNSGQSNSASSGDGNTGNKNSPVADQPMFIAMDNINGAWLKISPALAAILHSSTEFQP